MVRIFKTEMQFYAQLFRLQKTLHQTSSFCHVQKLLYDFPVPGTPEFYLFICDIFYFIT